MIVKYLIIALILYVAWRTLRRDVLRAWTKLRPAPQQATTAIDTVKCDRCGLYLPQGMEKNCGLEACPYPVPDLK